MEEGIELFGTVDLDMDYERLGRGEVEVPELWEIGCHACRRVSCSSDCVLWCIKGCLIVSTPNSLLRKRYLTIKRGNHIEADLAV